MSAPPVDLGSLFEAARDDGPEAGARDAVWERVAATTGAAAAATAAASASSGAAHGALTGASASKLLAIVAVIAALGATAAAAVTTSSTDAASAPAAARSVRGAVRGASLERSPPRSIDPAVAARREAAARPHDRDPRRADPEGDLAEEARLVSAARAALVAGDPSRALSLVVAARRVGSRALEPEELGIEARAQRALGRADDAAATELSLKRRFPDHALAR